MFGAIARLFLCVSLSIFYRTMSDPGAGHSRGDSMDASADVATGVLPSRRGTTQSDVTHVSAPSSEMLMEMVSGLMQSVQQLSENQKKYMGVSGDGRRSGEASIDTGSGTTTMDGVPHAVSIGVAGPSHAHEVGPPLSDRTCRQGTSIVASVSHRDVCAQQEGSPTGFQLGIDSEDVSSDSIPPQRSSVKRKHSKSKSKKGKKSKKDKKSKSSPASSEDSSSSETSECDFDNPHEKNTGVKFSKSVRVWFKQQRTNVLDTDDKKEMKERYQVCSDQEKFFTAPVLPEHLATHWERQATTKPMMQQDHRVRKASDSLLFSQLPLLEILQIAHDNVSIEPHQFLQTIQHSITLFGSAFHALQMARQKAFESVLPNKYASIKKLEPAMATLFGDEPLKEAKKAKQAHNVVLDMTSKGEGTGGSTSRQSRKRYSGYKSRYGQSGYNRRYQYSKYRQAGPTSKSGKSFDAPQSFRNKKD